MKMLLGMTERTCLVLFLMGLTVTIIYMESETRNILLLVMGALYILFGSIKDELE